MKNIELIEVKKNPKLINIFFAFVITLIILILTYIGVKSFFVTAYFESIYDNTVEDTLYKNDNIIENIIYIFIILGIILILTKLFLNKKAGKIFINLSYITMLIVFVTVIIVFRLRPIVDQGQVVSLGFSILNDSLYLDVSSGDYLEMFPYQFGMSLYISIVFKILISIWSNFWEYFYISLQVCNAIFSFISMILLYKIGSKIMCNNERKNKILLVLILFFGAYFLFFNTHIYGNIPGLVFALIALLFTINFIYFGKIRYLFYIGISISISILLKTNYQIFLIGIFIILFLDLIKEINYKKILVFIIIPTIIIVSQIINNIIFVSFTNVKVPDGIPMISYVYMGWAPEVERAAGWYTEDVIKIYEESFYDSKEAERLSKDLLIKRFDYFLNQDIKEFIRYAFDKFDSTWLNPTFQTIWCATPGEFRGLEDEVYAKYLEEKSFIKEIVNYNSNTFHIEERCFDAYQVIIFIFAVIGLLINKENRKIDFFLLIIIFLGGVTFHFVLWETKSIYVLQYFYLLLPYAAIGLERVITYFEIKIRTLKEKIKAS